MTYQFFEMSKKKLLFSFINIYKNNYSTLISSSLFARANTLNWSKFVSRKHNEACRGKKVLMMETMNEGTSNLKGFDSGNILKLAEQIAKDIKTGKRRNFCEIIKADSGDIQAAGLTPITFLRQVIVLCIYPEFLEDSRFSEDAKCRAKCILSSVPGSSLGTCPHHQGLTLVRDHIAEFISNRDNGIICESKNLFMHDGSAEAIKRTLSLFTKNIDGKPTGVLIPVPHPPFYSSWLTQLGLFEIGYNLDEKKKWMANKKELEKKICEAQCHSIPRVLVAINPGNPTGQVFSRQNVAEMIKFAHKEKLFIIADEIYQENIYSETSEFYSFKKVKHELGPPYDKMELASFLSASKGIYGECGLRGSCVEYDEIDKDVKEQIRLASSNSLGANTVGQVALSCMAKPPIEGCDSFEEYLREKCCILTGLMQKAKFVSDRLNAIEGISIVPIEGGLYGYGKVELPKKAIQEAKSNNMDPSELWCRKLLDSTGILVTPGTAFGAPMPDSYYFRTSFVLPFETLEIIMNAIEKHHTAFLRTYKEK